MEELVKFITKESLDKVPKDVEYLHKFNATDTKVREIFMLPDRIFFFGLISTLTFAVTF